MGNWFIITTIRRDENKTSQEHFYIDMPQKPPVWGRSSRLWEGEPPESPLLSSAIVACLICTPLQSSLHPSTFRFSSTKICLKSQNMLLKENCKIWVTVCEEFTHPPYCEQMLHGTHWVATSMQENGDWFGLAGEVITFSLTSLFNRLFSLFVCFVPRPVSNVFPFDLVCPKQNKHIKCPRWY